MPIVKQDEYLASLVLTAIDAREILRNAPVSTRCSIDLTLPIVIPHIYVLDGGAFLEAAAVDRFLTARAQAFVPTADSQPDHRPRDDAWLYSLEGKSAIVKAIAAGKRPIYALSCRSMRILRAASKQYHVAAPVHISPAYNVTRRRDRAARFVDRVGTDRS